MTLDQAVDAAMQLTLEQRAMLLDILHGRQIEARRNEITQDAHESIALFHSENLSVQTAEEAIEELCKTLKVC